MARWDFDCPQYVDFASGLDSITDDVCDISVKNVDTKVESQKGLTDEVVEQMDKQVKVSQSKIINRKDQVAVQKSPFVNAMHRSVKSTCVKKQLSSLQTRFITRTSSCMTPIAKLPAQVSGKGGFKVCAKTVRKRSSSLGDLRPKKKITYPMTPMCLKRTLQKTNVKKIKSSEEIQLEKIAELQKLLSDHLRINEISVRKLKLKVQPSCVLPTNVHQKRCVNLKEIPNKACKTEAIPFNKRLAVIEKEWRLNNADRSNVLRNEAPRAPQTFSSKYRANVLKEYQPCLDKSAQNLSLVSCSSKTSERSDTTLPNKYLTTRHDLHTGINAYQQLKTNTVVEPFGFACRITKQKEEKCKDQVTNMKTLQRCETKENVPANMLLTRSSLKQTRDKVVQAWEEGSHMTGSVALLKKVISDVKRSERLLK